MNTRRIVLIWTVCGCLATVGAVVKAADVSVSDLIAGLKSADESVRLKAIDRLGSLGEKAAAWQDLREVRRVLSRKMG